jgi:tRNA1(Val) A37 N6-methylase TrmN6
LDAGETLDAISGYFRLFQLAKGHRFSTDDVLTAWYGTTCCPAARSVLDLGSGVGAVGMIAAWRLPGARFVTVEAQDESARLARKSARWNGLEDRYEIRLGDFRDKAVLPPGKKFRIFRLAAAWKAIIRRKSPAVSKCAGTLAITAPPPLRA